MDLREEDHLPRPQPRPWWHDAIFYQIYPRSFADGNGDGTGDLLGLLAHVDHLRSLGVDAVWISPWYPSPMVDGGYDVADHRDVASLFGGMDGGLAVVSALHDVGIKVLLDIVPNHTSDQHPWFAAALAAPPGSPERARYLFRPGRGARGKLPPNNWPGAFGGPAWTRVPASDADADAASGEWYLHSFDPHQPDLDWTNPEVRDDFLTTLRFWFDLGIDGFRIDSATGMVKAEGLPDRVVAADGSLEPVVAGLDPAWDRPGVHEIYRSWRGVANSYDPPRTFVGEIWLPSPARLPAYLASDEIHTAFDVEFARAAWTADALRGGLERSLDQHAHLGKPLVWVQSNHDVYRHLSRLGRPQTDRPQDPFHGPHAATDVALGTRRARALLLLELALPGPVVLYQGEELGLEDVEDLPEGVLADPTWERSGHADRGRDGCRVPLPWTPAGPSFGFGEGPGWLPQPRSWGALSALSQGASPSSMLSLYREALALRRELPQLGASGSTDLTWIDVGPDVLAFSRCDLVCLLNLSERPVDLATAVPGAALLLASGPCLGEVTSDVTVWLSRGAHPGAGGTRVTD